MIVVEVSVVPVVLETLVLDRVVTLLLVKLALVGDPWLRRGLCDTREFRHLEYCGCLSFCAPFVALRRFLPILDELFFSPFETSFSNAQAKCSQDEWFSDA